MIGYSLHKYLHKKITLNNRIKVLSFELSRIIDPGSVLDVGCGSGEISQKVMDRNGSVSIIGIDVLVRPNTMIPVEEYQGEIFPASDNKFDSVIFIDVLHHTPNPFLLLKEAKRVSRKYIIIKDHNCNNSFQRKILSFTDWFGNFHFGVHLERNFFSKNEWMGMLNKLDLKVISYKPVKIYPWFTKVIFWEEMDFIIKLQIDK